MIPSHTSMPCIDRWRCGLLGALALTFIASSAVHAQANVNFSVAQQKRVGIATQKLASVQRSSEIDAFAKVLDTAPLSQLENDLEAAEAAAATSHAEAVRAKALHDNGGSVASKDEEVAQSQARQDALKIELLRRQIAQAWGPGVGRMSDVRRKALVKRLASGSSALVHVDTHNDEGQKGAKTVKVDVAGDSVTGRVIGPARQAEPRLQSSGLIVEISGKQAILLSVGLTQSAHIEESESAIGVVLPRGAIIRYRGLVWAYVRTGPTTFQRRLAQNAAPQKDGLFVPKGFAAGDEVVVSGADSLFAAEQALPTRGG